MRVVPIVRIGVEHKPATEGLSQGGIVEACRRMKGDEDIRAEMLTVPSHCEYTSKVEQDITYI